MSRVVYLHVGAPKTGTTYLQDRLDLNANRLREHGVTVPSGPLGIPPSAAHFKAALDLLDADWGGPPGHAKGQWEAMMRRVRRLDGTVILSHEILAVASAEQVTRAMGDLAGSEVHVVYSARDLARQIPAFWQESVKQGKRWSYKKFLTDLQSKPDALFWNSQGLPGVLGRWSSGLPPERVHLVTVPQVGAPRGLLWQRFCAVFGIDPSWAPEDSIRANPSMGLAETALVRRLNRRLRRTGVDVEERRLLVKELLVQQNLAKRDSPHRATLPPRLDPWVHEVAGQWVEWAEGSGIDVVGELDELRPAPRPDAGAKWVNPDRPDPKELAEVAVVALALMTEEAARRVAADQQLAQRVGRAVRRVTGQ